MTSCVNAETCSQSSDLLNDILERKEIKVGWVGAKPFQYRDENGKLTGAFVNAGNMLAADFLDVKITRIEARWDTFISGLQSGKFDVVISNVARRPNRATSVWFTKPIAIGFQALLVRKDRGPLQLLDIDQPNNTIVVRMGSAAHITYTENSSNFFKNATIKPIIPPVSPEQEVASGRAFAMGAPYPNLRKL